MNILIVANHYPVCSARYAADAFTRLGHDVRHVGQPMGRHIWGMQVPEEYVWTPDLGTRDPHLVIVMDSNPDVLDDNLPYGSFLEAARRNSKCKLIVWGVDNHVRRYERPYFDAYFLAHKSVNIQPYDENTFWLPCATDPVAFPPSPIPWADREYDVCCIGVLYPQRWELVNAMRAAGLKVLAGTGLVYDAYRDAHHNSRVALVSSFNGDLPIRLFEGAGMGCAVLCDEQKDIPSVEGLAGHLAMYSSVDSAVQHAQRILAMDADVMNAACQQSAAWVSQNHTWDKRAETIISWYN